MATQESSFESQIFEIIAQSGERCFNVHGAILSAHSKPLHALVSGSWADSVGQKIDLSEWDGDTVARFAQFLYTGDYPYPTPVPLPAAEEVQNKETQRVSSKRKSDRLATELEEKTFMYWAASGNGEKLQSIARDRPLWRMGHQPHGPGAQFGPLTPLSTYADQHLSAPGGSKDGELNYQAMLETFAPDKHCFQELLLLHAKMYALAQYQDVEALRNKATLRVLKTLSHISLFRRAKAQRVLELTSLVEYVYRNTDSPSNQEERLREVITQYAAINFTTLGRVREFDRLICGGGEFVTELMRKISRRLKATEQDLEDIVGKEKWISGLNISTQKARSDNQGPTNHVKEIGHPCVGDIHTFGPKIYCTWLVPTFTAEPQKACTGFEVPVYSDNYNKHKNIIPISNNNLDRRQEAGKHPYILMLKDPKVRRKITHLWLVRSSTDIREELKDKFDGFTEDIFRGKGPCEPGEGTPEQRSQKLYLVWMSSDVAHP